MMCVNVKKLAAAMSAVAVLTGGVFAQGENTITVDIGPAVIGLTMAGLLNDALSDATVDEESANAGSSGFGIGVQYEYQISGQLSVAGRFAYLGLGIGMQMNSDYDMGRETYDFKMSYTAIAFEGHARFYPSAGAFFLDGCLGYANMTTSVSGDYKDVALPQRSIKKQEHIGFDAPRHFFKLGAKLGWRIIVGDGGGFVIEPALGYDAGIGGGDTFGKQFKKWADSHDASMSDDDVKQLDDAFGTLENIIFVGGPRISLSFGWNF